MCSARGDAGANGVVRRDCELRRSSVRASGTNGVLLQAAEVGWANQERSVAGALRLEAGPHFCSETRHAPSQWPLPTKHTAQSASLRQISRLVLTAQSCLHSSPHSFQPPTHLSLHLFSRHRHCHRLGLGCHPSSQPSSRGVCHRSLRPLLLCSSSASISSFPFFDNPTIDHFLCLHDVPIDAARNQLPVACRVVFAACASLEIGLLEWPFVPRPQTRDHGGLVPRAPILPPCLLPLSTTATVPLVPLPSPLFLLPLSSPPS